MPPSASPEVALSRSPRSTIFTAAVGNGPVVKWYELRVPSFQQMFHVSGISGWFLHPPQMLGDKPRAWRTLAKYSTAAKLRPQPCALKKLHVLYQVLALMGKCPWVWGCACRSVLEHLPWVPKALGLVLSTTKHSVLGSVYISISRKINTQTYKIMQKITTSPKPTPPFTDEGLDRLKGRDLWRVTADLGGFCSPWKREPSDPST